MGGDLKPGFYYVSDRSWPRGGWSVGEYWVHDGEGYWWVLGSPYKEKASEVDLIVGAYLDPQPGEQR